MLWNTSAWACGWSRCTAEVDGTLPEEEEYEAAIAEGGPMSDEEFEKEVRILVAMAFGIVIVIAIAIGGLLTAYAITGWVGFLWLNLVVAAMAFIAFFYMSYRRSRLTMRI